MQQTPERIEQHAQFVRNFVSNLMFGNFKQIFSLDKTMQHFNGIALGKIIEQPEFEITEGLQKSEILWNLDGTLCTLEDGSILTLTDVFQFVQDKDCLSLKVIKLPKGQKEIILWFNSEDSFKFWREIQETKESLNKSIEAQIKHGCENSACYGFPYAVFEDIPKENLLNFANVFGYDLVEDNGVYTLLFKGNLAKQAEEIKQKRTQEVQEMLEKICTKSAEEGMLTVELGFLTPKEIKDGVEIQYFKCLNYERKLSDSTYLIFTDVIEFVENNVFLEMAGEEIVICKSPKYMDLIQKKYLEGYDKIVENVLNNGREQAFFFIQCVNSFELKTFFKWIEQRKYFLNGKLIGDSLLFEVSF